MKFQVGDPVQDPTGKLGKVIKVLDPEKFCYEYEVEFAPPGWVLGFYFGSELIKA